MKKRMGMVCLFLLMLAGTILAAKIVADRAAEVFLPERAGVTEAAQVSVVLTEPAAPEIPSMEAALPETTVPETTLPETIPPDVYSFTKEEEELLLKLGMAERGDTGCTECIALVMRTVLNRVEGPKFSSTIRGVIYAEDQYTPVADGSFEKAVPNDHCREALKMVRRGWDESQGALYYEWCQGESWHSKNLELLFQHCDTRFYQ